MKSMIAALSIAAALIAYEVFYPATLVITAIQDDVVTLETSTGISYQFTGAEDWTEGELVSVLMYNNGTPETIRDDVMMVRRSTGFSVN